MTQQAMEAKPVEMSEPKKAAPKLMPPPETKPTGAEPGGMKQIATLPTSDERQQTIKGELVGTGELKEPAPKLTPPPSMKLPGAPEPGGKERVTGNLSDSSDKKQVMANLPASMDRPATTVQIKPRPGDIEKAKDGGATGPTEPFGSEASGLPDLGSREQVTASLSVSGEEPSWVKARPVTLEIDEPSGAAPKFALPARRFIDLPARARKDQIPASLSRPNEKTAAIQERPIIAQVDGRIQEAPAAISGAGAGSTKPGKELLTASLFAPGDKQSAIEAKPVEAIDQPRERSSRLMTAPAARAYDPLERAKEIQATTKSFASLVKQEAVQTRPIAVEIDEPLAFARETGGGVRFARLFEPGNKQVVTSMFAPNDRHHTVLSKPTTEAAQWNDNTTTPAVQQPARQLAAASSGKGESATKQLTASLIDPSDKHQFIRTKKAPSAAVAPTEKENTASTPEILVPRNKKLLAQSPRQTDGSPVEKIHRDAQRTALAILKSPNYLGGTEQVDIRPSAGVFSTATAIINPQRPENREHATARSDKPVFDGTSQEGSDGQQVASIDTAPGESARSNSSSSNGLAEKMAQFYKNSESCRKAKSIIRKYAFVDVEPKTCKGEVYEFVGARGSKLFSIKISARTGELIEVLKLPSSTRAVDPIKTTEE
jgi:hypothetical protein